MSKGIPKMYINVCHAKVSIEDKWFYQKWKVTCYHDKRYQDVLTVLSVYVPHNSFKRNEAKIGGVKGRNSPFFNHNYWLQYLLFSSWQTNYAYTQRSEQHNQPLWPASYLQNAVPYKRHKIHSFPDVQGIHSPVYTIC